MDGANLPIGIMSNVAKTLFPRDRIMMKDAESDEKIVRSNYGLGLCQQQSEGSPLKVGRTWLRTDLIGKVVPWKMKLKLESLENDC